MKNIRIKVEYDGTDFSGWQEQPDRRTVQGELQAAARRITGEGIRIIGAGRTDQGVHALGQVAHFFTGSVLSPETIRGGINAVTGPDVHIHVLEEVDLSFHSRFSAQSRVYQYRIARRPSPIRRRFSWPSPYRLDVELISAAMVSFKGRNDFKHFSVQEQPGKNTVCEVRGIDLTMTEDEIIINIEADRFLRRMVRGMVGFLIDIGRGRVDPDDTKKVLSGDMEHVFFAPACGLSLVKVNY